MMKNILFFQKIILISSMLMSINMALSSNSLMGVWMSMEINMFSMIPMLNIEEKKNMEKSLMIYFMIQSISSMMFLFFVLNFYFQKNFLNLTILMMTMALLMKLGLFPFHFWFISMLENISWKMCLYLLLIQKIIPLMTIMLLIQEKMIVFIAVMNSLLASISAIKTFSMRKIMGFSSLNNSSLLLISISLSKKLFFFFFMIYFFMMKFMFTMMNSLNVNYIFQFMMTTKLSKMNSFHLFLTFMSLMGIPPFLGFFPKMMLMSKMNEFNLFIPMTLILTFNSLAMYFYLRMLISSFLVNQNTNKTIFMNFLKTNSTNNLTLMFLPIFYMIYYIL